MFDFDSHTVALNDRGSNQPTNRTLQKKKKKKKKKSKLWMNKLLVMLAYNLLLPLSSLRIAFVQQQQQRQQQTQQNEIARARWHVGLTIHPSIHSTIDWVCCVRTASGRRVWCEWQGKKSKIATSRTAAVHIVFHWVISSFLHFVFLILYFLSIPIGTL